MGIASLILGIISLVMMFLVLVAKISFGAIPTIIAIIGIILGIMGIKNENDVKAKLGLVFSIIYFLIFLVIAIHTYSTIQNEIDLMNEGTNYAEDRAYKAQNELAIKEEKEKIQIASYATVWENESEQLLTYENFSKHLSELFDSTDYILTGPDSNGNFTLKISTRTYTIDSKGNIKD